MFLLSVLINIMHFWWIQNYISSRKKSPKLLFLAHKAHKSHIYTEIQQTDCASQPEQRASRCHDPAAHGVPPAPQTKDPSIWCRGPTGISHRGRVITTLSLHYNMFDSLQVHRLTLSLSSRKVSLSFCVAYATASTFPRDTFLKPSVCLMSSSTDR